MTVLERDGLHLVGLTLKGAAAQRLRAAAHTAVGLSAPRAGCDRHARGLRTRCVCGACTVRIDSLAQRACPTLALQVEGRAVQTVEGLADAAGALCDLQAAFKRHHALQCGFCTPGILMSCADWLERITDPSEEQVRAMLSGHLCRCTGYTPIVAAILDVARATPAASSVSSQSRKV